MSNKMILKKAEDFVTSKWSGGSATELYIYPPRHCIEKGILNVVLAVLQ